MITLVSQGRSYLYFKYAVPLYGGNIKRKFCWLSSCSSLSVLAFCWCNKIPSNRENNFRDGRHVLAHDLSCFSSWLLDSTTLCQNQVQTSWRGTCLEQLLTLWQPEQGVQEQDTTPRGPSPSDLLPPIRVCLLS